MQATDSLAWTRSGDRFVLSGRIDEHADLRRLSREVPATGAVFDLGEVKRINSVGTREWIEFIGLLKERPLALERCPTAFIDQLNAIANFRGHAQVRSVQATFECEQCGTQQTVEVEIARTFPAGRIEHFVGPACERCGVPMQLDDEPERFFAFVRLLPRD